MFSLGFSSGVWAFLRVSSGGSLATWFSIKFFCLVFPIYSEFLPKFLRFLVGAFLPLWGCRSEPALSHGSAPIGVCSSEAQGSSFPGVFLGDGISSDFLTSYLGRSRSQDLQSHSQVRRSRSRVFWSRSDYRRSLAKPLEIDVGLAHSASGICSSGNG